MNLRHIVSGFKNFFLGKNKELAKKRYQVCKKCPDRKGYFCGICHCFLRAKTSADYIMLNDKSVGGCPKGLW